MQRRSTPPLESSTATETNPPSVLTQRARDFISLAALYWAFCIMTVITDSCPWRAPVFVACVLVNIVTTNAGRKVGAIECHFANIFQNVSIARVEAFIIRLRKINYIVLKQIVADDKVVRVWQDSRVR